MGAGSVKGLNERLCSEKRNSVLHKTVRAGEGNYECIISNASTKSLLQTGCSRSLTLVNQASWLLFL